MLRKRDAAYATAQDEQQAHDAAQGGQAVSDSTDAGDPGLARLLDDRNTTYQQHGEAQAAFDQRQSQSAVYHTRVVPDPSQPIDHAAFADQEPGDETMRGAGPGAEVQPKRARKSTKRSGGSR